MLCNFSRVALADGLKAVTDFVLSVHLPVHDVVYPARGWVGRLSADCVEEVGSRSGQLAGAMGRSAPSCRCEAPRRDQLGEFAQVLGRGGEVELVSGALGTTQPQAVELQNPFEVRKQHLDLLPFSP